MSTNLFIVKYMRRCCIPTARSPEVCQTRRDESMQPQKRLMNDHINNNCQRRLQSFVTYRNI